MKYRAMTDQTQPNSSDIIERLHDHALFSKAERCAMFMEAAKRIQELEAALAKASSPVGWGDHMGLAKKPAQCPRMQVEPWCVFPRCDCPLDEKMTELRNQVKP